MESGSFVHNSYSAKISSDLITYLYDFNGVTKLFCQLQGLTVTDGGFVELGCVPVTLAQRFAGTHHPILVPVNPIIIQ